MVADLVWRPQAREDLLEIYVYIGRENPAAAEALYTAIEAKAALDLRLGRREGARLRFIIGQLYSAQIK